MKSLFGVSLNWPFLIIFFLLIRVFFSEIGWYSYFAIIFSIYQFVLLFSAIGISIPIRYLLGTFMCLQFFIGPSLAYSGLDSYQYFMYQMQIPEAVYFSYAIPAVLLFILGLHLNAGDLKGEIIDEEDINTYVNQHPRLPYILIAIGLLNSILGSFLSADLAFIVYLIGGFKFVGLFLLLLSKRKIPFMLLIVIISSVVSTSLVEGMFHDLLTWLIFLACVISIRFKFDTKIKVIGFLLFFVLTIVIQLLKGEYRGTLVTNKEDAGVETFARLAQKKNEESGFFNLRKLAEQNVRINQGFIITNVMLTVPSKVPFSEGNELLLLLKSAVLPRFIAPDKLEAGDKTIFTKYSGINLKQGTSMALGSLGDAYLNFGIYGGSLFMFVLGLFYSFVINIFFKNSKKYPIVLLFTALVYYYPIRPDCDLQTILGHLIKSCFLIYVIIKVWSRKFLILKVQNNDINLPRSLAQCN